MFDGGSSKNSLEIKDKHRFKKRVSNPKPKKGKGTSSPTEKPTCEKCGKKHYGDCLKRTDNSFG